MRSPLDDVPPSPALNSENASTRIVGMAALALLFFALAYLVVFPNHEYAPFTTLAWESPPAFAADDSASNTGKIIFSIRLSSFENENMLYRVTVQYEGRTAATQNVSLSVNESKRVDFSIPVRGTLDEQNQIRVIASKTGADASAAKDDALLELVGYFSNRN